MRGWSSFFVGFLLLGVAFWSFSADGLGSSTLMCAAAAAFFFFCGARGLELDQTGDPTAVIDFVKDPAEAIVDTATERLGEWLKEPNTAEMQAGFDPDAAIARYMAHKGSEPAPQSPAVPAASTAPVRTFGRKAV